jgi:general stress protein YciG
VRERENLNQENGRRRGRSLKKNMKRERYSESEGEL